MANEKRLIPCGDKVTLHELLPGTIFAFGDDCIAVKSEYRCNNGLIEAFIIDSGERFWGGVHTAKEQNELMVQPLEIVDAIAELEAKSKWIPVTERLPEDDLPKNTKRKMIRCFVYTDKGTVKPCVRQRCISRKEKGVWVMTPWEWNKNTFAKPTHWMPMPQPQKGE